MLRFVTRGLQYFSGIYISMLLIITHAGAASPRGAQSLTDTTRNWRTYGVMRANQTGVRVYNYGLLGHPTESPSFEWPKSSGIHYANKFGIVIGGEVTVPNRPPVQIVTHSLDFDEGAESNTRWWEPVPGYCVDYRELPQADRTQGFLAMKDRPATWGRNFPRDNRGQLLWPGQFGAGKSIADQECYFKMDDHYNNETADGNPSPFFPDPSKDSRQGLGITIETWTYQFVARVAEDMCFQVYKIHNAGANLLSKLIVGFYGDPQIGGRSDPQGDFQKYDLAGNYVYFWDNQSGVSTGSTPTIGYLGLAFLETPGHNTDGQDNDHDGLLDESQFNGIDDDGDWQSSNDAAANDSTDYDGRSDDLGSDGIPNTGDSGEGNGVPDTGEPDFEWLDLDEVDQLPISSLYAGRSEGLGVKSRRKVWERLTLAAPETANNYDLAVLMAAGYFELPVNAYQKLAVLILCSDAPEKLIDKIHVANRIYKYNFNFMKAPELPILQAQASSGRVNLSWDRTAERSYDPILGHDFEGYLVYRSTDGIHWGKPITNSKGEQIFETPLAQFDSSNQYQGFHPVDVEGVRFYLGDNSGLSHTYVDQNLMNGVSYYYAVTAYDYGSEKYGLPPLECSKIVGNSNVVFVSPRSEATSNLNQIIVVPNPYVASSIYDRPPAGTTAGIMGERRIAFMNLPQTCTIRIYTVTGEFVRQISHQGPGGDACWDLQNLDGLEVAAGTYIYHIDAPEIGNKVGTLAIIK